MISCYGASSTSTGRAVGTDKERERGSEGARERGSKGADRRGKKKREENISTTEKKGNGGVQRISPLFLIGGTSSDGRGRSREIYTSLGR